MKITGKITSPKTFFHGLVKYTLCRHGTRSGYTKWNSMSSLVSFTEASWLMKNRKQNLTKVEKKTFRQSVPTNWNCSIRKKINCGFRGNLLHMCRAIWMDRTRKNVTTRFVLRRTLLYLQGATDDRTWVWRSPNTDVALGTENSMMHRTQ